MIHCIYSTFNAWHINIRVTHIQIHIRTSANKLTVHVIPTVRVDTCLCSVRSFFTITDVDYSCSSFPAVNKQCSQTSAPETPVYIALHLQMLIWKSERLSMTIISPYNTRVKKEHEYSICTIMHLQSKCAKPLGEKADCDPWRLSWDWVVPRLLQIDKWKLLAKKPNGKRDKNVVLVEEYHWYIYIYFAYLCMYFVDHHTPAISYMYDHVLYWLVL